MPLFFASDDPNAKPLKVGDESTVLQKQAILIHNYSYAGIMCFLFTEKSIDLRMF